MSILLTDEQIDKAMKYAIDWAQDYTMRGGKADSIPERQVAKAQLKKVVEWGDEVCSDETHHPHYDCMYKRCCSSCWQALLKEIN